MTWYSRHHQQLGLVVGRVMWKSESLWACCDKDNINNNKNNNKRNINNNEQNILTIDKNLLVLINETKLSLYYQFIQTITNCIHNHRNTINDTSQKHCMYFFILYFNKTILMMRIYFFFLIVLCFSLGTGGSLKRLVWFLKEALCG